MFEWVSFDWVSNPQFWVALLQIIWIDIILSGDNAVVIALACRRLPPQQQRAAILIGTAGAIGLRVVMATMVTLLLEIAYLKLIGSVLLLWIAVKLIAPQEEEEDGEVHSVNGLWPAVRTIIIADFVMSLDNVLGIAAAAKGSLLLLIFGLLISIPLIIFSSTLILRLMGRFPWIVLLGGALLGYVAAEMAITDRAIASWVESHAPFLHLLAPILTVALIVFVGKLLATRARPIETKATVDLATADPPAPEDRPDSGR